MKVFLAAVVFLALGILGMCVGVLAKRGFPKYDVGSNEEMHKLGITCYKDEDARIQREAAAGRNPACDGKFSDACRSCSLYEPERK